MHAISAYEAALAQQKSMRFHPELAQAFNVAYSDVAAELSRQALEAERAETEAKHKRRQA